MKFRGTIGVDQSGSLAGITASHNRGGTYWRSRVIPTNPATVKQQQRRANLTSAVTAWTSTLTDTNRAGWDVWAFNTPFVDAIGASFKLSGQNAYIGSAAARRAASLSPVATAPSTFDRGNFTPVVITGAAVAPQISIAFDNTDAWAGEVGGALVVAVSRPQNASRNYFKGPFQIVGRIAGAVVPPASPATFTSPFAYAVGQKMYVRVYAVRADGRWSTEQIAFDVV